MLHFLVHDKSSAY